MESAYPIYKPGGINEKKYCYHCYQDWELRPCYWELKPNGEFYKTCNVCREIARHNATRLCVHNIKKTTCLDCKNTYKGKKPNCPCGGFIQEERVKQGQHLASLKHKKWVAANTQTEEIVQSDM